jgi:ABC-2 type transport system ATP-binding protein
LHQLANRLGQTRDPSTRVAQVATRSIDHEGNTERALHQFAQSTHFACASVTPEIDHYYLQHLDAEPYPCPATERTIVAITVPSASPSMTQVSGAGKRGNGGPVLEAENLSKTFGDVTAVSNLSFRVSEGEVLGFLGPNGAGKSTTVGMILGLIRPTEGSVRVNGIEVQGNQHVVSEGVGAIIENPAFYPYLSGRDNLRAHAMAAGGVPDRRIDELLALVRLGERGKDKFKTYSLGMKQRLGIASTLLTDPALVIFDEPTNGLDPAGQRDIRAIIPRLADEGHSVLLASHLLHEVEQVSDRVAIVRRGELVTEGNVDELLKRGGFIEVTVPEPQQDDAMEILRRHPAVEQVTIEKGDLVVVAPLESGSELNRALVQQGIYAGAITPKRSTLESLFLELTEGSTV